MHSFTYHTSNVFSYHRNIFALSIKKREVIMTNVDLHWIKFWIHISMIFSWNEPSPQI